jgi:hypothetical protein
MDIEQMWIICKEKRKEDKIVPTEEKRTSVRFRLKTKSTVYPWIFLY